MSPHGYGKFYTSSEFWNSIESGDRLKREFEEMKVEITNAVKRFAEINSYLPSAISIGPIIGLTNFPQDDRMYLGKRYRNKKERGKVRHFKITHGKHCKQRR